MKFGNKTPSLTIRNLHASVEDKEILNGVDLTIKPGELHVVMGPNGSGKSTLANTLMGHPAYTVLNVPSLKPKGKKGAILVGTTDLTEASPQERALAGVFLAFQSPIAVPGVSVVSLLRTSYQLLHPAEADGKKSKSAQNMRTSWNASGMSLSEFMKRLKSIAADLSLSESFLSRGIHDGFSGGEKKKIEMLQALVLSPSYAVFDEIDTGLDVDALKTVAYGIERLKSSGSGILVITHYQRILKYLSPDFVHVLVAGKIVKTGPASLAKTIEEEGYGQFMKSKSK